MQWLLLNQHFAYMDSKVCEMSVVEDLLSSELQLVLLLVSGMVSQETMTSLGHGTGLSLAEIEDLSQEI